jgi:hypothetical protein
MVGSSIVDLERTTDRGTAGVQGDDQANLDNIISVTGRAARGGHAPMCLH